MKSVVAVLCLAAACGSNGTTGDGGGGGGTTDAPAMTADANVHGTNAISIIVEPDGNSAMQLVSAINAATISVNVTMYEMSNNSIINALKSRAQAHVPVKVILDGSSTNKSFNTSAHDTLVSAGAQVVWSNPSFTYTHEKCIIIDAKSAWIMTMNATGTAPDENREYLATDTDPADVTEAQAVFDADFAMHQITPSGALVVANSNARPDLVALINASTKTLDIEGEEFSDLNTGGIVDSTVVAVHRGVTVHVIIGNSSPDSTAIARVKQAGGKVVVSGPMSGSGTMAHPFIHAKAIVIDCVGTSCTRGFIGSENFSAGSLGYNRELGVIFSTASELAKVKAAIDTDFAAGVVQ
ncbi:MAG: phospholipase D-like domain-containing protein [Deltaproteobacteria bacterium]